MDSRGAILAANATLGRLLGRAPEELPGLMFDTLLSGSTRLLYHSYLQPLLRMHGNVEELSLSLNERGGATVNVLFYSARPSDAPDADHIDVVLVPIRRRRGIEDEMLRIKRAADQSPGLIFQLIEMVDGSLHFPYVSEAVRRLYRVTPDAVRQSAQAVLGCIDEPGRTRMLDALRDAAAAGREWSGVFHVTLSDGTQCWHEMHSTPRALANGVHIWHGHIADVTARRELERTLADREAADRASRMRSEFLARVSHELRTPLNGIIGFSQLLLAGASGSLNDTQRDQLGVIRSSGQHLLGLVNQVLDISALESAPMPAELQDVPVGSAILDALDLVRAQADANDVQLRPLACDPALQVRAHPMHLRQVLVNLLSNAIKYNRRGGHVEVTVGRQPQQVCVAVTDTGPGLSETQQAQLFQAFNRLGAQNTGAEGTGLGLVITRQLLAQMHGTIEVRSTPGVGSTFAFLLPLSAAGGGIQEPPSDSVNDRLQASGTATPLPPAVNVATHGTILYVEDNPVNVLLMEAVVGLRPGVVLEVVQTGQAALQALAERRPDLLLLDMHLPDGPGLSLLARLRALPGMGNLVAIAVSAAARSDDIATAMAHGFDDYWTKPLHVDRTLTEIDRWLSQAAHARQGIA